MGEETQGKQIVQDSRNVAIAGPGGIAIVGDHNVVIQQLTTGVRSLPTDYATRIRNFITEYLGTPEQPVPFGGREADLARLDEWLEDAEVAPYLLLAAPAGRGKSALLVRWSQRLLAREDLAVVFVPVSVRFRTNLGSVVFAALTARLAALHGDEVPGSANTSVEMWRGMASDYLARPLPDGRRLVVILDGADEAADWQAGADLFPLTPLPGGRVILSTRFLAGDTDAVPWLQRLGWERPGLASVPELVPLTREGVGDVPLCANIGKTIFHRKLVYNGGRRKD
ncbi:MAG: ATP-binding protein [Chloroflexi bacterium]|nr:ATP-binding protein [Chloroflexota bacterium]